MTAATYAKTLLMTCQSFLDAVQDWPATVVAIHEPLGDTKRKTQPQTNQVCFFTFNFFYFFWCLIDSCQKNETSKLGFLGFVCLLDVSHLTSLSPWFHRFHPRYAQSFLKFYEKLVEKTRKHTIETNPWSPPEKPQVTSSRRFVHRSARRKFETFQTGFGRHFKQ